MAQQLTPTDFHEHLDGPITIVDFWADWCGPCKTMAPVLAKLEAEYGDRVKFLQYDVDQDNTLPQEYKVMSMPSLVLFRDGVAKEKVTGLYNYQQLSHYLERKLAE